MPALRWSKAAGPASGPSFVQGRWQAAQHRVASFAATSPHNPFIFATACLPPRVLPPSIGWLVIFSKPIITMVRLSETIGGGGGGGGGCGSAVVMILYREPQERPDLAHAGHWPRWPRVRARHWPEECWRNACLCRRANTSKLPHCDGCGSAATIHCWYREP